MCATMVGDASDGLSPQRSPWYHRAEEFGVHLYTYLSACGPSATEGSGHNREYQVVRSVVVSLCRWHRLYKWRCHQRREERRERLCRRQRDDADWLMANIAAQSTYSRRSTG